MMPEDAREFYAMLDSTYDLIGVGAAKVISGPSKAMFFEDLQQYPLDLIKGALRAHRQDPERGKFTPKPADIVFQIERRRAVLWISADEAWSKVPKTEGQPGLLNDVTIQALAVAQPFLDQMHQGADGRLTPRPDMTAARMAFKGCYDRLAERAKLERRPPKYFVSPGGSFEEQQAVVDEGVRLGLLPAPALPIQQIEHKPRTPGAKPDLKALLLSLQPKTMPPPEASDYDD